MREPILERTGPRRAPGAVARLALASLGALALVAGGCGDDDEATPPPRPAGANRPPTPGGPAGAKATLTEKPHIEDRVGCPVPDRPSDPRDGKCDPKVPSCGEHLYCLELAQGNYCEPCPERDGIRHAFKERDFVVGQNRDPFQSFLFPGLSGAPPDTIAIDATKKCVRQDQMVAAGYSYADLKLVGIVAQGTQRKALMMGGPLGYIIKRGDCVGREKAVVKDIGAGFITFQVDPDQLGTNQRAPDEYSVQLNPKQLTVSDPELPAPAPATTIAPVVAPPATLPPRPGSPAAGTPAPGAGAAPGGAAAAPRAGAGATVPVEAPPAAPKKK